MEKNQPVAAVYNTHQEAEEAIKELQKSGFDMKQLSIVGRDYHSEEQVVGYYNAGDRMKYWGNWAPFGRLLGSFLEAPFSGYRGLVRSWSPGRWWPPLLALWKKPPWSEASLLSGAGLYSIGIPKDSVIKYETALKAKKFVVIAHGTAQEVKRANDIMNGRLATASHQ